MKKKKRKSKDVKQCKHCRLLFTAEFKKCISCNKKVTWKEVEDLCNEKD